MSAAAADARGRFDMTDHTTGAAFTLWHPVLDDDGSSCSFDVRPFEFVQLKDGSQDLLDSFLACLGVGVPAAAWDIRRFCSPYYREDMRSADWLDRYPLAWRVRATLTRARREFNVPRSFGPYPCGDADPTWRESDDSWQWDECNCVAVADFFDAAETGLDDETRARLLRTARHIEEYRLGPRVVQMRFDLGVMNFPQDGKRVDDFVHSLKLAGASVNWGTTLHAAA
jgi:hypothetical protein